MGMLEVQGLFLQGFRHGLGFGLWVPAPLD